MIYKNKCRFDFKFTFQGFSMQKFKIDLCLTQKDIGSKSNKCNYNHDIKLSTIKNMVTWMP